MTAICMICPECLHTHVAGDVVALGRFASVTGFRTPDGKIHETRLEAQAWLCVQRQGKATRPVTSPGKAD